jgi:signal transduction histidine kinase
MLYPAPLHSLKRRLVSQYLMFALAGLFACIGAVIALALHGSLLELAAVVIILPLALLGIGAAVLARTVRLNATIEEQLQKITTDLNSLQNALQPLPEAAPAAIGWNLLVREIREHKVADTLNSRLNSSVDGLEQRRWEAIFNSLPDGIALCDRHHTILKTNNSLGVLLAQAGQAKLVGQNLLDLLERCLSGDAKTQLAALRQGSGSLVCEIKLGSEWSAGAWRVSRLPLLSDEADAGQMLWILRDITQHKLAEEMRNQFVFTATHELRTPLTNIKAYAETLTMQEGIDVEKQKGFYNIINAEATRLGRFVDDLLSVSQMESGSLGILRHEADLERLLAEITEHVLPQAQQKQVRFDTKFPAKFPKLRLDKDKFAAALINLLGNAIKYTPEAGSVTFSVEVGVSQINFIVEDSGIGIAADELPRLGEKFFRSGDERVRAINGSGLGLTFTQEVARLHGGKLSAVSELNKGSRFTLSLPLSNSGA